MKTAKYHESNLGRFAPTGYADRQGYITIHQSGRYGKASDEQLQAWLTDQRKAVRAAAATEIANRNLREWRN